MNYSKTKPKDYTSLYNIKSVIAVSSDILALINSSDGSIKSKKDITVLLDGKDNALWILEADANMIQSLIDDCYDARENKWSCEIITEDGTIIKFN